MRLRSVICITTPLVLMLFVWSGPSPRAADSANESVASNAPLTFERDVRPILKTHCFHCHGEEEELAGGLDVRLRRLLAKGGDSGPVNVAGTPSLSILIERLRRGEMPPGDDPSKKVSSSEIDIIARWIAAGAVTTRTEPDVLTDADLITEEERAWWSFQPVVRAVPPTVKHQESYTGNNKLTEHDPPVLYNLEVDPSEQWDVAEEHPEIIAEIKAVAVAHGKTVVAVPSQLEIPLTR
jgi:mono/diheme cytochrome c family protein